MKMKINYMRVNKDIDPITVNENGEWVDLRLAEDVFLSKGEFKILSLGIRMQIPKGFEVHIVPRSSTFKKFQILQANSVGIIDSSYQGPDDIWGFPAIAAKTMSLKKNIRICQFRIEPSQFATKEQKQAWLDCDGVTFEEKEWLEGNEESRGGFGSSGVN